MSEHPDLVALVRGELGNLEATAAGDHLLGCGACHDEVVEVLVGHALLHRASRTVDGALSPVAGEDARPLPALLPVPRRDEGGPGRVRRIALSVAAAVALVAAGVGVGVLASNDSPTPVADPGSSQSPPETSQTPDPGAVAIVLQPVEADAAGGVTDGGAGGGEVRMVPSADLSTEMVLETHDLPPARDGQFYYAWLLDPATDKMLPLGQVGPWGRATFQLDDTLLTSYSAVDVSLEADDGDPEHSVTSVLRGSYATS